MVCDQCKKKQSTLIVPDKWKEGARNTIQSRGVKINANLALQSKSKQSKANFKTKCRLCKSVLHAPGAYCQACAYKKGICTMCGKKILSTKFYAMSAR